MPEAPKSEDAALILPRADEAEIDTRKLHDYALYPSHPQGMHKARVFLACLNIERCDWRYLHDQILEKLPAGEVTALRPSPWGLQYDVRLDIDGLNGETHPVLTKWLVQGDDPPALVTLYVDV